MRAICNDCGKDLVLRKDGRTRRHWKVPYKREDGSWDQGICSGSGELPAPSLLDDYENHGWKEALEQYAILAGADIHIVYQSKNRTWQATMATPLGTLGGAAEDPEEALHLMYTYFARIRDRLKYELTLRN